MSDYAEKLRDPRWQKKRLEIFERDGWQCCTPYCALGSPNASLQVHHRHYEWGKDPWDYDNSSLITLCEPCHSEMTQQTKRAKAVLQEMIGSADIMDMSVITGGLKAIQAFWLWHEGKDDFQIEVSRKEFLSFLKFSAIAFPHVEELTYPFIITRNSYMDLIAHDMRSGPSGHVLWAFSVLGKGMENMKIPGKEVA